MEKVIYFDMDGTIADLYGVDGWLGDLRSENPRPYRDAAPFHSPTKIAMLCNALIEDGWKFGVISWLSKDSSKEYKNAVRWAKREWLAKHFPVPLSELHLIQYGQPKHQAAKVKGATLIDDDERVGQKWLKSGGEWVNPTEINIIEYLEELAARV